MSLKQIAIAIDQLLNTLLGGMSDETLSARAHRTGSAWEPVIDALFFWQMGHCPVLPERKRTQATTTGVPEMTTAQQIQNSVIKAMRISCPRERVSECHSLRSEEQTEPQANSTLLRNVELRAASPIQAFFGQFLSVWQGRK